MSLLDHDILQLCITLARCVMNRRASRYSIIRVRLCMPCLRHACMYYL